MKKTAIILAALLMTSTAAYSDGSVTGAKWADDCSSTELELLPCLGYIQGVGDMILMLPTITKTNKKICMPPYITTGQTKDLGLAYLVTNPEIRNLPAAFAIYLALLAAFPCK